jgi:dipeptidyl aminopeptidase/acylaminoacyl peptidase
MATRRAWTPEDFWQLRTVGDPQVSPDGVSVAFVVGVPDQESDKVTTTIWVAPTDGSAKARQFTAGPEDGSPRWSPDGRALAFVAKRGESPQLYVASLEGGEPKAITEAPYGVGQPCWRPDGRELAFVARTGEWTAPERRSAIERSAPRVITGLYNRFDGVGWFDARRSHIFVVGAEGGEARQLTDGDFDDLDPEWSPDGKEVAFASDRSATRVDEVQRDVYVVGATGRHRPRRLTRGRGNAASPRWSPDGRTIAYIGHEHADGDSASNTHLLLVDARDPSAPRSISERLDRTVWGILRPPGQTHAWSADGSSVFFVAVDGGALCIYRSGIGGSDEPEQVLGGDRQILCFHMATDTIAFAALWPSDPPEVSCCELDGHGERRVSDMNAATRKLRWAQVKKIRHKSADGLQIESFVMYPADFSSRRPAPTALEIHGGPHGWHPQVSMLALYQCLAAAGYVVVLVNPRGSHGYGEEFARACVGDWGGRDFEDLMAVLDHLVETKVADEKHLYVAGYSYGGYMTSWAVGHTKRFAAACVSAPVADLTSMWGTTDIPNFATTEIGGLPWDQREAYARHSPVTYLPEVTTPVQLLHWEGDLRCPIGQAEELFQGLRKLGREVVMVRYPDGFHILRTPSQMVDFVQRHLDWFGMH